MKESEAYRHAIEKLRAVAPDFAAAMPTPEALEARKESEAFRCAVESLRTMEPGSAAALPAPEPVEAVEPNGTDSEPLKGSRTKAQKGLGRTFRRGEVWWVAYYHRGREFRESTKKTGSKGETAATKLLKKRLGETGNGRPFIGPSEEKVTFEDMAKDLERDYAINARRSVGTLGCLLRHLCQGFAEMRAVDITTDRVRAYVADRQKEGAANASINRELEMLKRMFTLAVQAGRLNTRPHIPLLEENNARQGFLDHAAFQTLRTVLPDYLQDPVTFLYLSGWRVSEMRGLEWRDVDLPGRVVRLRPELSKNKDGRVLPLSGEVLAVMERAHQARRLDCVNVFHVDGQPIGDFRKSWKRACIAAGLSGLIVHDLRRTAVRNMSRAGIPERVAMALSGHKTRAIFDRYNIVSESDLTAATERLHQHLEEQPKTATVLPLKKAV